MIVPVFENYELNRGFSVFRELTGARRRCEFSLLIQ